METLPYCGPAPGPVDLWIRWNADPILIAGLLALLMVPRRHPSDPSLFVLGWLILAVLFVSPLCALTTALFSARVVHHGLLIAVAAPLLVLGGFRLALPRHIHALRIGFPLLAAALVTWHLPAPYALSLASDTVYWLMQASLFGGALLVWQGALARAAPAGAALGALLGLTVVMGLIGAVLTFAPAPLYAAHLSTTRAFGLDPLEDQQLAGLIMWVPMGLPFVAAALAILRRMLAGAAQPAAVAGPSAR